MKPTEARKRYFKVFVPSMALYLITILGATSLIKGFEIPIAAQYGLAIIPALAVWWLIWAQARYYREADEFERSRQVTGVMFGVAVMMLLSTGWGLLELLVEAPAFPVFYLFPLFCVAYSFGRYLTKTPGEECS